jgi:hypothetical protein
MPFKKVLTFTPDPVQTAWSQEYKIAWFLPEDFDLDSVHDDILPVAEPESLLLADVDFELLLDERSESGHVGIIHCQPQTVRGTVVVVHCPQRHVFLVPSSPSSFHLEILVTLLSGRFGALLFPLFRGASTVKRRIMINILFLKETIYVIQSLFLYFLDFTCM